MAPTMHINI